MKQQKHLVSKSANASWAHRRWKQYLAYIGVATIVLAVAIGYWQSSKLTIRSRPISSTHNMTFADDHAERSQGEPSKVVSLPPWESTSDNTPVADPNLAPAWQVDPPRPVAWVPSRPIEPMNPATHRAEM